MGRGGYRHMSTFAIRKVRAPRDRDSVGMFNSGTSASAIRTNPSNQANPSRTRATSAPATIIIIMRSRFGPIESIHFPPEASVNRCIASPRRVALPAAMHRFVWTGGRWSHDHQVLFAPRGSAFPPTRDDVAQSRASLTPGTTIDDICGIEGNQALRILKQCPFLSSRMTPTEIRHFMALPTDLPVHMEVVCGLLEEPWTINTFLKAVQQIGAPYGLGANEQSGAVHRCSRFDSPVSFDTLHLAFDRFMDILTEEDQDWTPGRTRRIRATVAGTPYFQRFDCLWLLRRLDLIAIAPEDCIGDERFVFLGIPYQRFCDSRRLKHFSEVISAFQASRCRPSEDALLVDIEDYVKDLIATIQNALFVPLSRRRALPQLARRLYLRLEYLTGAGDACGAHACDKWQYFIKRFWYWRAIEDMGVFMEVFGIGSAIRPKTSLAQLASVFHMHPFMVFTMAGRIQDAIKRHGAATVEYFLNDSNCETFYYLAWWFSLTNGDSSMPPTPTALIEHVLLWRAGPVVDAPPAAPPRKRRRIRVRRE